MSELPWWERPLPPCDGCGERAQVEEHGGTGYSFFCFPCDRRRFGKTWEEALKAWEGPADGSLIDGYDVADARFASGRRPTWQVEADAIAERLNRLIVARLARRATLR